MTKLRLSNLTSSLPAEFYEQVNRGLIGFDKFFDHFDRVAGLAGYPPHNVIKIDNNHWQIELAVAGLKPQDVTVTEENGVLTIASSGKDEAYEGTMTDYLTRVYLHKGIANRNFSKSFTLGEDVKVREAKFQDGLLTINVEKEVPEAKKARVIEIKSS